MKNGHVYVIESGHGVKVGVSAHPDRRIRTIETGLGCHVTKKYVSKRISDAFELESAAKSFFSDKRINGEWFRCSFDEMKMFVSSLEMKCKEDIPQDTKPTPINVDGIFSDRNGNPISFDEALEINWGKIVEPNKKDMAELSMLIKEKYSMELRFDKMGVPCVVDEDGDSMSLRMFASLVLKEAHNANLPDNLER